jgi:chaperonin GroEL
VSPPPTTIARSCRNAWPSWPAHIINTGTTEAMVAEAPKKDESMPGGGGMGGMGDMM